MIVVAFNTECSRDFGTYCEMCSFGYVVANSDLKIELSKKFYIKALKPTGRQKRVLKTPFENFKNAPRYSDVYPIIKNVFEQKNAIFISHSPETDFRYISCMARRYGLSPILCTAYDILSIVRNYANIHTYSLSGIMKIFGLKYAKNIENADAKACVDILKYICDEEHTDLKQLLMICGKNATVDSEVIHYRTTLKIKQKRLDIYYSKKSNGSGKFKGFAFSMDESFENSKIEIGFHIAEIVTHYGGTLTRKVSESQVFVWDGRIDSKRLESVNVNKSHIEVITTKELFSSDYMPLRGN
ncbi:MAG: hypothetical protein MJZ03_01375 [archaeon]|nr:hypothetical protein [archaeon]